MAHPGGRPQTLTPEQIETVRVDLKAYIEREPDPTIVGFTSSYDPIVLDDGEEFYINKNYIGDHDEFSELRKRAIEKQEAYLVKNAGSQKYNPTVAIFRLKQPQHGYKDRMEQEITNPDGSLNPLNKLSAKELKKLASKS